MRLEATPGMNFINPNNGEEAGIVNFRPKIEVTVGETDLQFPFGPGDAYSF